MAVSKMFNITDRMNGTVQAAQQTTKRTEGTLKYVPTTEEEQTPRRINYDAFFREQYGRPPTDRDRKKLMDALDGPTELRKKMIGWKNAPTLTDAIYASLDTLHISDEKITEQYVLDTIETMATKSRRRNDFTVGFINRTAPLAATVIIGALAVQGFAGFRDAARDNRVKSAIAAAEQVKADYAAKEKERLEALTQSFVTKETMLKAQYEDKTKDISAREGILKRELARKESELITKERALNERFFSPLPTLTERVKSEFTDIETQYMIEKLIGHNTLNAILDNQYTNYDQTSPQNVRILHRRNVIVKYVDGKIVAVTELINSIPNTSLFFNGDTITKVENYNNDIITVNRKGAVTYRGRENADAYKQRSNAMMREYQTLQSRGPNGLKNTDAQKPATQKPAQDKPLTTGEALGKAIIP